MMVICGAVPSVVYLDNKLASGTNSVFTFAGVSLGAEKRRRRIVAAIANIGSTPVGLALDGVPMTVAAAFSPNVYYVDRPAGLAGTFTFTQAVSTSSFVSITVWAIYDCARPGPQAVATSTSAVAGLSLDVHARGVVTAIAAYGNNATGYAWTGVTRDYQQTSGTNNVTRSAASIASVAGGFPLAVACSMTGTPRAVAVSWR